jgi:hypothetical protein
LGEKAFCVDNQTTVVGLFCLSALPNKETFKKLILHFAIVFNQAFL